MNQLRVFGAWSDCGAAIPSSQISSLFLFPAGYKAAVLHWLCRRWSCDDHETYGQECSQSKWEVNKIHCKYNYLNSLSNVLKNSFAAYCGSLGKYSVYYLKAYTVLTSLWEALAWMLTAKPFRQIMLLLLCELVQCQPCCFACFPSRQTDPKWSA